MFVFTRSLETKKFKAVAGMGIPPRLDNHYGRNFLRKTYGEDIITEVDYSDPDRFLTLIAKDSDQSVREKYSKLKLLTDSQAKVIKDLQRENEQLKKQVGRTKLI